MEHNFGRFKRSFRVRWSGLVMEDSEKPSSPRRKTLLRIGIAVVLVLIALCVSYSIRMVPKNLSGLQDQVASTVYSNIKAQIANSIQQQNPGLPQSFIQGQIDSAFTSYVNNASNKRLINQVIQQGTKQEKTQFIDPATGRPFMPDIDPYFWLYYADNIVATGHPGDSVHHGVQWDNLQLAPNGRAVTPQDFITYLIAGLYTVMHPFNHNMTTMLAQEWYPVIVFTLIVILTFLIASSITNKWGGFFAAVAISLIPGALSRTLFGRGDTDALVIFFPLLALYLFMEAFTVKDLWAKLTFASLAGFVTGFFAWAWSGWWYIAAFVLATIGIYGLYRMARYAVEQGLLTRWPWLAPSVIGIVIAALVAFVWIGAVHDFSVAVKYVGFALAGLGGIVLVIGIGLYVLSRLRKGAAPTEGWRSINYRFWDQPGVWQPIAFTAAFSVIAMLAVLLFMGSINPVLGLFRVFSFGKIKAPTLGPTFFPNVYTTVAELNPAQNLQQVYSNLVGVVTYPLASVQGILGLLLLFGSAAIVFYIAWKIMEEKPIRGWLATLGGGLLTVTGLLALFHGGNLSVGTIMLSLGLIGIVAALVGKQDADGFDVRYGILLLVWVAATTYATLLGIRFVLLLAPAFAIATGAGAGYLVGLARDAFPQDARKRWASRLGLLVMLCLVVFFMPGISANPDGTNSFHVLGLYEQAHVLAGQDLPLMDATWYALLTQIRNTTPPNTIITSWWDFGHIFKYFAHRPVTFDGTTQNTQAAHWVGKLLLTRSQKESIGILRMLDCSGGEGFNRIDNNITHDQFETLHILDNLTTMNQSQAEAYLTGRGYNESDIAYILAQTHCTPPEGLLIASGDMVGKAGVWGHFGAWDFRRADVYDKISNEGLDRTSGIKLIEQQLNETYTQAFDTYDTIHSSDYSQADQWIAGYPGFLGISSCTGPADNLTCDVSLQQGTVVVTINATEQRAFVHVPNGNGTQPVPFGMLVNGTFVTHDLSSPVTLGFALLPGNSQVIVSSPEDVGSIFELLYYYNGSGLPCYDTFKQQPWPQGGHINTYSANWTCADKLSS